MFAWGRGWTEEEEEELSIVVGRWFYVWCPMSMGILVAEFLVVKSTNQIPGIRATNPPLHQGVPELIHHRVSLGIEPCDDGRIELS